MTVKELGGFARLWFGSQAGLLALTPDEAAQVIGYALAACQGKDKGRG